MKARHISLVFYLFGISFLTPTANATHVLGVEIEYNYISSDTIEVFMSRYYDCSGLTTASWVPITTPFSKPLPPGPLTGEIDLVIPTGCVASFQPWVFVSFEDVTPLCPALDNSCVNTSSPYYGIARAIYKSKLVVGNCNITQPITFAYRQCCRSASILNLTYPNGDWIYAENQIFPQVINSSPEFIQEPILRICNNSVSQIDLGGVDPDGDSLVYTLSPCYDAMPPQTVGYAPTYSPTAPLGPNWVITLDSVTGFLTFIPTPGSIEVSVICIGIEEYRNGNLIGKTTRDLVFETLACPQNSLPKLDSMYNVSGATTNGIDSLFFCPGVPLSFDLLFSDTDVNQALTFSSNLATSFPGATISTSGSNPLIATITWNSPDSSAKELKTLIEDDNCPLVTNSTPSIFLSPTGKCFDIVQDNSNCLDSAGSIAVIPLEPGLGYTYLWNTGASDSSISALPIGTYWVNILDTGSSLVFTDTFFITANDLVLSGTVIQPACDTQNGSIYTSVSGGTPPYSFQWSNGATSDSLSGLAVGGYHLIVTDSIGCFQKETYLLEEPDSCFVTIQGKVFYDANGDCMLNSGEVGLPGVLVDFSPGGMVTTDLSGEYTIQVDTGLVNLKAYVNYLQGVVCPDSQIVSSTSYGTLISDVDFAVAPLPIPDLSVFLHSGNAIINGKVKYTVTAHNWGSQTNSGALCTFEYPLGLSFDFQNPLPQNIDTLNRLIFWNTDSLTVGSSTSFTASFFLDPTLSLGDQLTGLATIETMANEQDTANNISTKISTVVGSYDPNDKQVSPAGIDSAGFILPTTATLDYTIRFQNTGNFPATFVVLRDTLSPLLDLTQYNTLGFSHPFTLTVEEDSIMVFTFANINLPDSMSDPLGSQGFIEFQLGLEAGLPVGTKIENDAAIYFDFNPPIFTNTVLNTIYTQLDVELTEDSLYCIGDPIFANLIATGKPPYTFDWNFGGPSTTNDTTDVTLIFQTGWYVVTVTDDFGFSDTDSVLVIPEPGIFADFEWELTGNGFEVAFTDSSQNGASYFWDFGNGDTSTLQNPVVVYTQPGEYIVKFAVTNICGADTSTQTIRINNDAIDSWPFEPISIQPNPFTQSTKVIFPLAGNWSLKLYDLRGKMVYQEVVSGIFATIERGSLSDGIYYLEVSDGEHWDRRKIIITD